MQYVILGGGGHAAVIVDCIHTMGLALPRAILDPAPALRGKDVLGIPILGGDNLLPAMIQKGLDGFVVGLGASWDCTPRKRLFELGLVNHLEPVAIRHPWALMSMHASTGPGIQLLPGSIVNARSQIGANVVINSGAIVEHDCVIQDHVFIATGAKLCSTVRVGQAAFIGAGAVVRQCVRIGKNAVIGAGAVVVADVPPDTVVGGVPARTIRNLKNGDC